VLAERRERRAWVSSPALARRAEAAEATVRTLEAHLTDLRRRQLEVERERELASVQLAERELELRRVKQREYAEQQLRVEAEEAAVRLRRSHRAELDRLQRRAEEAHAAARHAEEQRDELAARLAGVGESCARLQRGVAALQSVAAGLRTLERDHVAALAERMRAEGECLSASVRIRELEGELERALARPAEPARPADPTRPAEPARSEPTRPAPRPEAEGAGREEMAGALAAAVERLRARASTVGEELEHGPVAEEPVERARARAPQPDTRPPEVPTVIVVPRLFASPGHQAARLAPAIRRVAARLTRWADRAQDRAS
jgi:chromosome segregation ATPase